MRGRILLRLKKRYNLSGWFLLLWFYDFDTTSTHKNIEILRFVPIFVSLLSFHFLALISGSRHVRGSHSIHN